MSFTKLEFPVNSKKKKKEVKLLALLIFPQICFFVQLQLSNQSLISSNNHMRNFACAKFRIWYQDGHRIGDKKRDVVITVIVRHR